MSRDQKFKQRWEFKRRDNDFDSSSTDTKSSSSSQPDFKKQKMSSSLIFLKNDEDSDNPLTQQKSQVYHDSGINFELGKAKDMQIEPSAKGNVIMNKKEKVSMGNRKWKKNNCSKHEPISLEGFILHKNDKGNANQLTQQESQVNYDSSFPFELGKVKKKQVQPSAKSSTFKENMKRVPMGKGKRKKNNCRKHRLVSMDGFKFFMNSILEELKVEREKMLTWMREEMQKLVAGELASRLKKKKGNNRKKIGKVSYKNNVQTGIKAQNHNDESLEIDVRSDSKTDSCNCHVVLEELANQEQAIGAITSNEKKIAKRSRSSAVTQVYSSSLSNPIIASLCLGSSEACAKNHKLHSSLNDIQPGPVGSKTGLNYERTSVCIDAIDHGGFCSGLQQAKQLGSLSKMGSQNVDHLNQHAQTSTLQMDFSMPLHQGKSDNMSIASQANFEMSSRSNKNFSPRKKGEATRISRGSYALLDQFTISNFRG